MTLFFAETYNFNLSGPGAIYWLLLIFSLVLIVRYGVRYLLFRKRLHDIKGRNVVVPEYVAPPKMPPAFFGVIIDNRSSGQDLPATILSLELQGYLELKYDESKKDFRIQPTTKDAAALEHEHERFVLEIVTKTQGLWAGELRKNSVNVMNEFTFLVQRDLQRAGYYFFLKNIDSMNYAMFYGFVIARAVMRGLIKPWNWPGLLLSLFLPAFGVAWLVVSVVFHNRLGIYTNRTAKWEEVWPEVAGYYNYLRVVEAEKRTYELADIASFEVREHDPYLAAALLQKQWYRVFTGSVEIGAGGNEYHTM